MTDDIQASQADACKTALIYVGPLNFGLTSGKTAVGVAKRVHNALGLFDDSSQTFSIKFDDPSRTSVGSYSLARVATISRDGAEDSCELYEYAWSDAVTESWTSTNRVLRLAKGIVASFRFPRYLKFFATSGKKNPRGEIQTWVAAAALVMMSLSVLVLAVTLAGVAIEGFRAVVNSQAADSSTSISQPAAGTTTTSPTQPESEDGSLVDSARSAASTLWRLLPILWSVIFAGLLLFSSHFKRLVKAGDILLAAESYLRLGELRAVLTGSLQTHIDDLVADASFQRIDIIAYSFGSILTLDMFFPGGDAPSSALKKVDSLSSIGVPLDWVRAVNPSYYSERACLEGAPQRWRNTFSPIDMFGSNFRDDTTGLNPNFALAESERCGKVVPDDNQEYGSSVKVTRLNALALVGFSAHGAYWGRDDSATDQNALTSIVWKIYGDTPLLAPPPG